MMYTLHCSKKTEILEWDRRSFTDCGPEEADFVADEVMDVVKGAECDFKSAEKWTLEKAIDEARVKTQSIVDEALEGYSNLQHAMVSWGEFKGTGVSKSLKLDGWGDEEVTDANCTKNDDGTVTYEAHTIHFADPYGGLFNVVKMTIKVEVIPAEE